MKTDVGEHACMHARSMKGSVGNTHHGLGLERKRIHKYQQTLTVERVGATRKVVVFAVRMCNSSKM